MISLQFKHITKGVLIVSVLLLCLLFNTININAATGNENDKTNITTAKIKNDFSALSKDIPISDLQNYNIIIIDENGLPIYEKYTDGEITKYTHNDNSTTIEDTFGNKNVYKKLNNRIVKSIYSNNELIYDIELSNTDNDAIVSETETLQMRIRKNIAEMYKKGELKPSEVDSLIKSSDIIEKNIQEKYKNNNINDQDIQLFLADSKDINTISSYSTPTSYYVNGEYMNGIMYTSDFLYNGSSAMSPGQIQSFLVSKNSILQNTIKIYAKNSSGTVYDTGRTCIPYSVIYNAAVNANINPKIILITMQREQSLITKTSGNVNTRAFYYCMGYGATDSGDNLSYSGFDIQVQGGAQLFYTFYSNASMNATLSVNNGVTVTRNGETYPGSIVNTTLPAYSLYKYCPWTFDTSITSTFTGGNYLFIKVFEGWWNSWY